MIRARLIDWLVAPRLTGLLAFACFMVMLAVPAIIRVGLEGSVTGCEFTPFLPFVLIAAVLLRWWQAALVSAFAVAILGGLFPWPGTLPCARAMLHFRRGNVFCFVHDDHRHRDPSQAWSHSFPQP